MIPRSVLEETDFSQNSTDPRVELVSRVVASALFSRAPKLQDFLTYISERSIAQQDDQITEYLIGIEVFKRNPGYSPGDDNIVRSYARMLRKRLNEYFATIGRHEELLISIPRGGYVVKFHTRKSVGASSDQDSDFHAHTDLLSPPPPASAEAPLNRTFASSYESNDRRELPDKNIPLWCAAAAAGLCLLLAVGVVAYRLGERSRQQNSPAHVHRFWSALLGHRPTVIVPDDTGLTVALGLTQRDVTAQEYVSGQQLKDLGTQFPQLVNWDRPFAHRYTDLVDLLAISRLMQMPEVTSHPLNIRYARDLRPDELEHGNIVLIGGSNANPWVKLFDADLNFSLHFLPQERTFEILNRQPQSGELASYPYSRTPGKSFYGLVAVRPNLTNSGNVLLIEGVTNSGLQAAVDFCLDDRLIGTISDRIVNADGSIRPFEVLVSTDAVGSNPTRTEMLGFRMH